MPTHKSNDYKLSAVKYYLSHSKNQIQTHIYKNLIKGAYERNEKYVKRSSTRKRKPKKYLD